MTPPTNGAVAPPYLSVPGITDPELQTIPELASFQALNAGERLIKPYQIRVRQPKFPWLVMLLLLIVVPLPVTGILFAYMKDAVYRQASPIFDQPSDSELRGGFGKVA